MLNVCANPSQAAGKVGSSTEACEKYRRADAMEEQEVADWRDNLNITF